MGACIRRAAQIPQKLVRTYPKYPFIPVQRVIRFVLGVPGETTQTKKQYNDYVPFHNENANLRLFCKPVYTSRLRSNILIRMLSEFVRLIYSAFFTSLIPLFFVPLPC